MFAPWRGEWARAEEATGDECVFCAMRDSEDDRDALVVLRGERAYVALNLNPYNRGHSMVVPDEHTGAYRDLGWRSLTEHAVLTQVTIAGLDAVYDPDGFNVGMNLGVGSGGSVKGHLHTHVIPRWSEDTDFLPVTGETTLAVSALEDTYDVVVERLADLDDTEHDGDGAVRYVGGTRA